MSDHRALAHKLTRSEDGTFGSNWNYTCDQHPLNYCLETNYFSSLIGNFLIGDSLRLTEIRDDRVYSTCLVMIVFKDVITGDVEVQKLSDIVTFEHKIPAKTKEKLDPLPQYIKGDGQVEWDYKKRIYQIKDQGNVVAEVKSKQMAHAVARGDKPIPVAC
tara:strand:+ start:2754 stop:3233 length:480 start_codon:yes stop_codon:yes gene_type:complete